VEIRRHFEAAGFEVPAAEVHPTVFGLDAMDTGAGEPGPRVVPARNQVFVSIAVSMAAARGFDEVWMGAQAEDASDYPDCRPGWVEAMDRLAQAWGVRVRAPLLGLSRSDVRALGNSIGAPLELCSSCYQPDSGAPCGTCNSCLQDTP
jgi:7-cyano-7-deazaguanine synthase